MRRHQYRTRPRAPGAVPLLLLLLPGIAAAQDDVFSRFVKAQQQNAAELRSYRWMARTELKVGGQTKGVRLESVRYGESGTLQKTLAPTADAKSSQKDVSKGVAPGLSKLAESYAALSASQFQAMKQHLTTSPGEASQEGTIRIASTDVVVPGDTMAVWVDARTLLFRRIQIYSKWEKYPVQISAHFEQIPGGPVYPAWIEMSCPAKVTEQQITNDAFELIGPPTVAASGGAPAAAAAAAEDPGWPRVFEQPSGKLLTYQPQVDSWKDFKDMTWRMAVAITPAGGKEVIGAVTMRGQTEVDNGNHLVTIRDMAVTNSYFPSLDAAAAAKHAQLFQSFLPPVVTIALERVVASTPKPDSVRKVEVKNDPPVIFLAYKPTVLVDISGDPVYVPVQKTGLEYILNSPWSIFKDKADGHIYLLAGEQWMTAPDLKGPWTAASKLPADMTTMIADEHWAALTRFIPLRTPSADAVVPDVFVSTVPAEVILFEGQPTYTQVPGTQLSYANNTVSYVFRDAGTNRFFYLTSGRWFSASGLNGPWKFASDSLPEDFAKIPRDNPAAQVLASVPGTEEAQDAVLIAQIPTRVSVDPVAAAASAKVKYDGDPKFQPIEGTSMAYATNTAEKVIKVGSAYYLCLSGIWFTGPGADGPWETAKSVPDEVYTIPPSSPVYNVTYVTQSAASDGSIEASYTAGYTGAVTTYTTSGFYVSVGTGYYYPPYIGYYPGYMYPYYPYYYARPYTYGAAAFYNPYSGAYGVAQTAWGPYGSVSRAAAYNPYTGTYARAGSVATPYGRVSGAAAYNPYTGAAAATRQGGNAYSQWGSSVVSKGGQTAVGRHYSDARGTVGTIQGSGGGGMVAGSGQRGSGFAGRTGSGDMYAGKDGNVYRNTGSGWQKYENGGWNSPSTPRSEGAAANRASGGAPQAVQGDVQSRQRGSQATQQRQQRSSGSYGSGGYSGSRGGGGFSRGGGGMRGGGRRR